MHLFPGGRAIALLVDEGLVVIVPGKGAFVKPQQ